MRRAQTRRFLLRTCVLDPRATTSVSRLHRLLCRLHAGTPPFLSWKRGELLQLLSSFNAVCVGSTVRGLSCVLRLGDVHVDLLPRDFVRTIELLLLAAWHRPESCLYGVGSDILFRIARCVEFKI